MIKRKLILFYLIIIAVSNGLANVRVTGDRVSLRSAPSLDSAVLNRAMSGEILKELDRTNNWIAVEAPHYMDAWVAASYISNGIVTPEKLNVRSGPNRNYAVLTIVERGTKLKVMDRFNDWIKVTPPKGSRVWISSKYTESIAPEIGEMDRYAPSSASLEKIEGVLPTLSLKLDKEKKQGLEKAFIGRLEPANPGLFQIISENGESLCLVKGRNDQLEELVSHVVKIEGIIYFVQSTTLPILQPKKIIVNDVAKD